MTTIAVVTETTYVLAGTSSLGPFATVFPYEQASDVTAWIYQDTVDPIELTLNADFTVAPPSGLSGGGAVLLSAAILATYSLVAPGTFDPGVQLCLQRRTTIDQPTALGEEGGFSPSLYEAALDHVSRQVQDAHSAFARALIAPLGEALNELPPAPARAGYLLSFDPTTGQPVCTFSFTGDAVQGPPGPPGPAGPPGPQGAPGAGSLGYTPLNVLGAGNTDGAMVGDLVLANVAPSSPYSAGRNGVVVNERDVNYTIAAGDSGGMVRCNSATPVAYLLQPQATVALESGVILFRNVGAGALTINPGAGVHLRLPGAATDAAIVLAQWGLITGVMEAADNWVFQGVGATN